MPARKRVHLKIPARLRVHEKGRGPAISAIPEQASEVECLRQQLERMRHDFKDLTDRHHDAVYRAIALRYEKSCDVASTPALLHALSELSGSAVTAETAIRSYFKLSVPDAKKASKYYRRIKPIWDAGGSKDDVYTFLVKEGVEKKRNQIRNVTEKPTGERHVGNWTVTDKRGRKIQIGIETERRELVKVTVKRKA